MSRWSADGWRVPAHLGDNEPPASSESPLSASSPERLAEWIGASPEARSRALAKCLETIALKDPRIHAWVQISPQSATETGPLSGVPFGAKDIIDTRGLVTAAQF